MEYQLERVCKKSTGCNRKVVRLTCIAVFLTLFIAQSMVSFARAEEAGQANRASSLPALIPLPAKVAVQSGHFLLRADTRILTDSATADTGTYLAELLAPATGYRLKVEKTSKPEPCANSLVLVSTPEKSGLGEEGYELLVAEDRVVIGASTPAGVFYGVQTLRQLLPADIESKKPLGNQVKWTIPCVRIEDKPVYRQRGVMLDPARQFLSADFIKRYIDLLAFHKMNWLHLHLTDTVGWTVGIKKYPQLTDLKEWPSSAIDPKQDRGFYSREELRELVAYAAQRHITIVPEIEMPSHFTIAAGVLPDVLCPSNPLRKLDKRQWTYPEDYPLACPCPGSEKTFEILDDIVSEIIEIFPSPYIHIGGDEWYGAPWADCPACGERIEKERLGELEPGSSKKDMLYRYFMRRMCRHVVSKGRQPIFWYDKAWEGHPFPEGSVVHMWHEWERKPHVKAAKSGHDVLSSAVPVLYFDLGSPSAVKPVYQFDPMPEAMMGNELSAHLLGMSAPLWNIVPAKMDVRAFPRTTALAEIAWTQKDRQNWDDFSRRLAEYLKRLQIMGVDFAKTHEVRAKLD